MLFSRYFNAGTLRRNASLIENRMSRVAFRTSNLRSLTFATKVHSRKLRKKCDLVKKESYVAILTLSSRNFLYRQEQPTINKKFM